MTTQPHFRKMLVDPFEREVDFDWDTELELSPPAVREKAKGICLPSESGVGACVEENFEQVLVAITEEQLDW